MAVTSWTHTDLESLERAIAQGALRVRYADKEVEYRSLMEMLQLADVIRRSLGLVDSNAGRKFAQFSKGLE